MDRSEGSSIKLYPLPATAVVLLCVLALPALPGHRRKMISSTKEFLIDGKRYLLDRSAGKDIALIRREASRLGFDVPLEEIPHPSNPCFEDSLREVDGEVSSSPLPLSKELHPDHVVQMVSDTGPVGLAAGSLNGDGPSVRNRLPATGWKCIDLPPGQDSVTVATLKKGKESYIVVLEEKKGKFLLVRKPE